MTFVELYEWLEKNDIRYTVDDMGGIALSHRHTTLGGTPEPIPEHIYSAVSHFSNRLKRLIGKQSNA